MKTGIIAALSALTALAASAADTFLPFEKYVNWGYTDAVKGDMQGGWTDEGPNQDARYFPFDQKTFAGVPFHIVDEKTNGGRAIFTFRGWQCNNRFLNASVPLEKPVEAKFLYLLHASCWLQDKSDIAKINVYGAGGRKHVIDLDPDRDLCNWWSWKERTIEKPNAVVGAYFDMSLGNAAAYVSKFPLPADFGPVEKVDFNKWHGSGTTWLVLAATLSDTDYPLKAETVFYTKADDVWREMNTIAPYAKPGTALDFSSVVPTKPVSETGRVLANVKGEFYFEKIGEKARFLIATCVMEDVVNNPGKDKKDVDEMMDRLRRAGYNAQRYWTGETWFETDPNVSKEEYARRQDMFGYMVKCARDRGMYFQLSFTGVEYAKVLKMKEGLRQWKDSVAKFLNSVNPYTGIAYKDDESIFCVDLNNELEFGRQRDEELGKIPTAEYTRIEMKVSEEETALVRQCGFKGLVANFLTSPSCRYDAIRWKLFDFVSRNVYFQHPPTWTSSTHLSSVRFGADHLRSAFVTHEYSRPQIISEHGYPYPQKFRHEQAFVDGAYAALNGFGGLTAFRSPLGIPVNEGASSFMMCNDPVLRSSEYLTALMFVRGDVKESPCTLRFTADADEDLKAEFDVSPSIEPYYLGFVCKTLTDYSDIAKERNEVLVPRSGTAKASMNIGATNVSGGGGKDVLADASDALKAADVIPAGNRTDPAKGVWESVTGELCMDQKRRRLTVCTPRLQGVTAVKGDSCAVGDIAVRNLSVNAGVAFASIDGTKPLKKASRILLVFATDAVNSEAIYMNRFREDIKPKMGWPKQLGHAPILIETGSAELTLKNVNAANLKLWSLNVDGTRAEEIPVTAPADTLKFKLDTAKLKAPSVYFELAEK